MSLELRDPSDGLCIEVQAIQFRNEENGWTVLGARNRQTGGLMTAVGSFPFIRPGEVFEVFGSWIEHKKFGKQYKIERAVALRPKSPAEILKFLGSGVIKGIGPKTAKLIVAHFGEQTLEILDRSPERLLEIPKIGAKKLRQILDVWDEGRAQRELQLFLTGHDISAHFSGKIVKAYGTEAHRIIAANPYRLATDIAGIGFLRADKIAASVGIPADSPERVQAAIVYLLKQAADSGHCFLTTKDMLATLGEKLNLAQEFLVPKIADCLISLNQAGLVASERHLLGGGEGSLHYLPHLLRAERRLARNLLSLLAGEGAADGRALQENAVAPDEGGDAGAAGGQAFRSRGVASQAEVNGTLLDVWKELGHLSELQRQAVGLALSNRIFILTGGPGVGKTTTANAIIRGLTRLHRKVQLCAPTGRAAQRLSEVSGSDPAKTVHRLLEWIPELGTFARGPDNPVHCDVLLIDEASMLDLPLADSLFAALPPRCQVIVIGDPDQLPSVGPGNVLRNLIECGVFPGVHLNEIFRQQKTSEIVEYAHQINQGRMPEFSAAADSDCRLLKAEQTESVVRWLDGIFLGEALISRGFDPKKDVQVLTPMNKGELGTVALNARLQNLLNPEPNAAGHGADARTAAAGSAGGGKSAAGQQRAVQDAQPRFRAGDKVIQTSNNYELGIFNGDIGWIQSLDGKETMVAFGERLVGIPVDDLRDLQLAYAISIHKSQGSEFPVVILIASMAHYVMLQRNLFYTGLTRARRLALIVGAPRALAQAVKTQSALQRRTLLARRLTEPALSAQA